MQKVATLADERAETLAQLEAAVSGKPIRDCRVEVAKVSEMFRYYAGYTDKLHGQVIPVPSGHLNYSVREPLGVIFQITPWNAPMFTAGWQIAPAIACGNGVVLKPSELTPVTSIVLAVLCQEAGAVWTNNVSLAHRMAAKVRAGTFWVNGYKAIHVSTPFGGSRNSGFGRSSGMDALMEYTEPQSVWVETAEVPRVAFDYAPSA